MIIKPIDGIEEADLKFLIENAVPESRTLEYKEAFPSNTDADKKEFLADISALANSSGGDIIYGLRERAGVPSELIGIEVSQSEIDSRKLWIEELARQGIEPRIFGLKTEGIPLSNGRYAVIIRVPKSWSSPHCVTLKGTFKFYGRGTNGKYMLDVNELKSAFIASDTLERKLKEFRLDRISQIVADEGPVKQGNGAKIIVHIMPLNSFNMGARYDVKDMYQKLEQRSLRTLYGSGHMSRINFDGVLAFSPTYEGISDSYMQIFNNGIGESVNTSMLDNSQKLIPCICYEKEIIKFVEKYLKYITELEINPSYFIAVTLVNIKGYKMETRHILHPYSNEIDRDILLIPGIVVEDLEKPIDSQLKPIFDSIWNSCGRMGSSNYNNEGIFAPKL